MVGWFGYEVKGPKGAMDLCLKLFFSLFELPVSLELAFSLCLGIGFGIICGRGSWYLLLLFLEP